MRTISFTALFTFFFLISCGHKDMALNKNDLDTGIDPGTDFYQYANGGWMRNNPMPPEFSRYGSFDVLSENTACTLKELIEGINTDDPELLSDRQKVKDFFKTGMDEEAIEAIGMKPVKPELDLIYAAENIRQIQEIIFRWHSYGSGILFNFFGAPDRVNSEMILANLYQGGLGLTDVDYYILDDENSVRIRNEYRNYITKMFILAGFDENIAGENSGIVFRIETRLAKASMSRLERRDPHLTFNKMKVSELVSHTPEINWNDFFLLTNAPSFSEINVGQPAFFKEIDNMMRDVPLDEWKAYVSWHILNRSAEYLSSDFVNTHFDFYGRFLSGKQELQPRWKRVLRITDAALGEALGKLYVEKYFPPEAKERMDHLVLNLRNALADRIKGLEWMSEETKMEALEKLNRMNVKIGYPGTWRDYSGLMVSHESYFVNVITASQFNYDYHIRKIGQPVDPDEWGMTPHTVNAYYSPGRNEIVFPAGILQPPFFNLMADDAVNYGAIGMVIGHEMTHGFDDKGRKYDKDGNLRDWWTTEDAEKFTERSKLLVEQYENFVVLDGVHANGKLTLGENIADLGGLSIAFTALKKAWEENTPLRKISGFTPEQRFFLGYAHVWAQNITDAEILKRTREDVHSLGRFRVNGPLPNMNEFYEAFSISENEPMYIKPEDRASIW